MALHVLLCVWLVCCIFGWFVGLLICYVTGLLMLTNMTVKSHFKTLYVSWSCAVYKFPLS